ncbi:FHA domain-containing protein [Rhodobacter capsulatus]|uniref:FHA domain-containing protein n=1 Tax=Rhodobacter capsulatus TaxID=1061 RepID=UPI00402A4BE0
MSTEKTSWVFDQDNEGGKRKERPFDASELDRTTNLTEALGEATVASHRGSDDEATQITGRASLSERTMIYSPATHEASKKADEFAEEVDPVVGWLVVLNGPGKGRSLTLGHGLNLIGRSPTQRVALDFGDTLISNEDHAKIIYEDGEYYIAHGTGKNVTKLDGKMIPNMVPLNDRAIIQLSKNTTCVFVALCGPDFDWSKV